MIEGVIECEGESTPAEVKRRFFLIRNCWGEREELDQEVDKEVVGRERKTTKNC